MKRRVDYFLHSLVFLFFMFSIFITADLPVLSIGSTSSSSAASHMLIHLKVGCSAWKYLNDGSYVCIDYSGKIVSVSDSSARKDDKYSLKSLPDKIVNLLRERDGIVLGSFTVNSGDSLSIYEIEWNAPEDNTNCDLTPKSSFDGFVDKFKKKFPFDIFEGIQNSNGTIDDCLSLTFGIRNYSICSIKPLIEVVKNIVLLRMVLNAFWSI